MNSAASARIQSSLGNSSSGAGAKSHSSRDELASKRYNLIEPDHVFPLDGFSQHSQHSQSPLMPQSTLQSLQSQLHLNQHHSQHQQQQQQQAHSPRYPDFQPWKHTSKEDEISVAHLQKGYMESPHVANELLSARNIMHQLLRSKSSLDELSTNLLKAINVRSTNNTIGQGLFKPPPRVTLTDQKREGWLKDLASSNVPLRKLARTIPHGVRNKVLLEQCVAKNIPMNRALWLVRCISTNELRGLKRKGGPNIELNWVQEWTTQVVEYIEKLSLDYLKFENFHQATESWKLKISYILRFCSNLFIENLIDHDCFKNWISRFFKNCKNFEIPLALTIVKIFWDELLKTDYLIKELTESLTLRYQKVSLLENMLDSKEHKITDTKLNEKIKVKLLEELKDLILQSFNHSIDNFILPNNWDRVKVILKSLLNPNDPSHNSKFELISYRNQSLMINYSLNNDIVVDDLVNVLDNLKPSIDYKSLLDLIFKEASWKENFETLFYWCVTKYRNESHRTFLFIEILKKLKSNQLVPFKEIEQQIMDIIFQLHHHSELINFTDLFLLLNKLITIKTFKVSIYIRRLISSGLIYLTTNQDEKQIHSLILKNLKSHKSSQATMVLRNLDPNTRDDITSEEKSKKGLDLLKSVSIDDVGCLQYINSLETGVKLNIAGSFYKALLCEVNLFPLLTYKELERILKTFETLNDQKHLFEFIIKALESNVLEQQQLELIIEVVIADVLLVSTINLLDKIVELILINIRRLSNTVSNLAKFKLETSKLELTDELSEQLASITESNQIDLVNIHEMIIGSGVNLLPADFARQENFHNNFQVLIKALFSGSNDLSKRKVLTDLLSFLKSYNQPEFNKVTFLYVKKTYNNSTDIFKFEPLFDLVISELVSLEMIVDTFLGFNSSLYTSFVLDLLFKDFTAQTESFDFYKLNILRQQFKSRHPNTILQLMRISLIESDPKSDSDIQSESSELINSMLPDNSHYKSDFLSIFPNILIHHPNSIIDIFFPLAKVPSQKIKLVSILNETLLINDTNQDINTVLLSNLQKLNRFNLPIFQMLFKLILDSEVPDELVMSITNAVFESVGDGNNKLFGDLFKMLDIQLKLKFIHHLESLFLNSKNFPSVFVNDQKIELSTISEILTTLSKGSQNFELKQELIFSLDISLESLLKIVSQTDSPSDSLYDAIFLFLKIIIIHKSFLIGVITERNSIKESFLNNIVSLLTTNVVSQNLQLKNLLYDLILSIKSTVNELNSIPQTNIIKLPLSIINLPAISIEVEPTSERPSYPQPLKRGNLNDFNTVNNLFLYQKGTMAYHDFNIKPFDLLEESNPIENINDTAISLQLFEASLERKNPI